ncbi:hypothetical protein CGRA01v4_01030 [Colletotrichum graminicola]|nr:hypothetical protein CGRA01v4_01030 [Colletotrichum graminicola]
MYAVPRVIASSVTMLFHKLSTMPRRDCMH